MLSLVQFRISLSKSTCKAIACVIAFVCCTADMVSQCCSAGSGSPIAGGYSQGVLSAKQLEFGANFQYINSAVFLTGREDAPDFLDNFQSSYVYGRVAYGVSKDFTMSIESGYWAHKGQVGLDARDTNETLGIGDLILFPRYDVLNSTSENNRTEITLGLGFKIPLGSYNDSARHLEPFSGNEYYVRLPLAVQTSSGANDIIFYGFFYRGFPDDNFNLFSNIVYIRKGWNPIGEKLGDYASVALFGSTSLFESLSAIMQLRFEWIDQMSVSEQVDYTEYDPEATGSKKLFVSPQLSYTFADNVVFYGLAEIPVYQYVSKTQIASQYQFTFGITYRMFVLSGDQSIDEVDESSETN